MSFLRMVRPCASLIALSAVVALGLLANSAKAVESYYFDLNGATAGFGTPVTGSTYDWDDPSTSPNTGLWSDGGPTGAVNTGATNTVPWVQATFPRFDGGTTGQNYTVTVSRDIQIAGMFNQLAGTTLNINAVGSGTLDFVPAGVTQGIINSSGSSLFINAPISGTPTTIINPNNGGNIYFNGINTYAGGTSLTSTGTLLYFNNSSSFGTGTLTNNDINTGTPFVPMLAQGGTTVTLANNFAEGTTATVATHVAPTNYGGINFAADANTPLILTGSWNIGATAGTFFGLRNNGVGSSPITLSGVISGAAGIVASSNSGGGTIFISGAANTYTGPTMITGPGAPAGVGAGSAAVTVVLGAPNAIASSSSVVLAGGILDPNGINQSMPATTLNLSGTVVSPATFTSTIDYTFGNTANSPAEVDFANSSAPALAWSPGALLNLKNWNTSLDKLRFGTDSSGLTMAQLADIEADGAGLGTAHLNGSGYVFFGAAPVLAGDYNNNGVVDAADYVLWRHNVGQPAGTLGANDTAGGVIGPNQYALWRSNFGNHSGSGSGLGSSGAVPEPSSIALLLLSLPALVGRRRHIA